MRSLTPLAIHFRNSLGSIRTLTRTWIRFCTNQGLNTVRRLRPIQKACLFVLYEARAKCPISLVAICLCLHTCMLDANELAHEPTHNLSLGVNPWLNAFNDYLSNFPAATFNNSPCEGRPDMDGQWNHQFWEHPVTFPQQYFTTCTTGGRPNSGPLKACTRAHN
jgi:hypothetical protein